MKRKRRVWGIVAVAVLGVLALAGGKLWSTLKSFGGGKVSLGDWLASVQHPREQFPGKNRVNILLIGMDYSYLWTKRSTALNGARYTKNSRADSIMMLSLDLDSGRISALSVPRDTRITAPDGRTGKINGTFSRGGPKLTCEAVADLLGVAPDYYVAVKPDAVRDMVNTLGGVSVVTKDAMEYNDAAAGLHILLPAGPQEINGDQAVGFARFREADKYERGPDGKPIYTGEKDSEGNPVFKLRHGIVHSKEEGDPNRMARQQQLIRAMAAKAKSPANWMKLDQVVDTTFKELETNLSRQQVLALMALFRGLQPDQMQSATLEGKGTKGGVYFFLPDEKKKAAMVDWLLKGDETAADRLTVVAVENATNVPGAAARVAEKLRAEGFDAKSAGAVSPTDAAPATTNPAPSIVATAATRIVYGKASVATRAQKIAQLLGVAQTQVTKDVRPADTASPKRAAEDRADVTVILGQDLAATFGPRSAQL